MLKRRFMLSGLLFPVIGEAFAQAPKKPAASAKPAAPARPRKPAEPAVTGTPAQSPVGPVDTAAKYAIAIDFHTGATLLEKDADVIMTPSSMTKLMTAYIVYGMLRAGRLKLDQEFPVSERAWRMGGSKMFVPLGGQVKVEDLIRGMIIQSGNDACIVLAEGIAGSEEQFVELMNQRAKELGLDHSKFRNTTGWPDPEHRMSARDIATLARRLIMDFPEYYKYDAEKSFKYNNIEQENRNTLVQKGIADGLKTGHTEDGGYGMVVSALRGGRRTIVVVNGLHTMRQRAEEAERLLDWTFREYENVTFFAADEVVEHAPVWLGVSLTVPLIGGRDIVMTLPRGWREKAKVSVEYTKPIPAPVMRGRPTGFVTVSGTGMPDVRVPLLAGADVPRLGLTGRAMAALGRFVSGS